MRFFFLLENRQLKTINLIMKSEKKIGNEIDDTVICSKLEKISEEFFFCKIYNYLRTF